MAKQNARYQVRGFRIEIRIDRSGEGNYEELGLSMGRLWTLSEMMAWLAAEELLRAADPKRAPVDPPWVYRGKITGLEAEITRRMRSARLPKQLYFIRTQFIVFSREFLGDPIPASPLPAGEEATHA